MDAKQKETTGPSSLGRKPRVLFLVSDDWYFVSHRLRFAVYLKDAGYEVAVACRDSGKFAEIREAGIQAFPTSIQRRNVGVQAIFREVLSVRRVVLDYDPDLVHVVALRMICLAGLLRHIGRRNYATVNAVAGMGMLFANGQLGLKLRLLKRAVEIALRQFLDGPGVVTVFQNSDDLELARSKRWVTHNGGYLIRGVGIPMKEISVSRGESQCPLILFAGRLLKEKGVVDLVEASKCLNRRGVVHRLRFLGSSDDANPNCLNADSIRQFDECDWIEFPGRSSQVLEEMRLADIVALPSYYREGIPKVLLEAGSIGRPVIACDVAGCREFVRHEETGFVVPPRNPKALAEAIETLIRDRRLGEKMGRANWQRTGSEFSEEVVFEAFARVYREVMQEGGVAQLIHE